MDVIPPSTRADEVTATVRDLEGGLDVLPLSKAVNRIDTWRQEILAAERDDLRPIADALGELHEHLTGLRLDGKAIGAILVRLGEGTAAAADGADEPLRSPLQRLGSVLRHAGHALGGNAADGAARLEGNAPAGAASSDAGPDTPGDTRSSSRPS